MRQILLVGFGLSLVLLVGCGGQAIAPENAKKLESNANSLVDSLSRQEFSNVVKMFDSTMKSALPEAKLTDKWKSITAQVGSFKSRGDTRTANEQGYDVVYVPCTFERASLNAKVVFSASGEVAGLFFL